MRCPMPLPPPVTNAILSVSKCSRKMLAILATITLFQNCENGAGSEGEDAHPTDRVEKFRQSGGCGLANAIHDGGGEARGCTRSGERSRQFFVYLVKFVGRHFPPPSSW